MRNRQTVLALFCVLLSFNRGAAGDPEPPARSGKEAPPVELPKLDPEKLRDPAAAARAADDLETAYRAVRQPEAVRMLLAILRGPRLGAEDGWFGPAETRYTWKWLAARNDLDPSARAITREQFRGPEAFFRRLDRDGDGRITPGDFDWSERNPWVQQSYLVSRLFRRMNTRGDGKITREDLDAFLKNAGRGKDHLTTEDLRDALLGGGAFLPGDAPSVPMLVRALYSSELGSLHEGPHLDEAAPDFALKTPNGERTVRLSKLVGPRPVVLVFGNFTCPPFRAFFAEVDTVYERYKDDAVFVMVYVREAHPTDGWKMESNEKVGVSTKQPTSYPERVKVCEQFCGKLKPSLPVVVDEIDDGAGNAYSAMPARMYVIDGHGKVAFKSGRGPYGFRVSEMEQALVMALLERGSQK
jgi:hypothetical protein